MPSKLLRTYESMMALWTLICYSFWKFHLDGFPLLVDDPDALKGPPCPHEWEWEIGQAGALPFERGLCLVPTP